MMRTTCSIVEGEERFYTPELIHRKIEKNIDDGCAQDTAIIFNSSGKEKRISYEIMNKISNQMARYLISEARQSNCVPNTDNDWLIGICIPPNEHIVIAILAILKTGSAYLPLESKFPLVRIEHILNEAKPIIVLYDKRTVNWSFKKISNVIMIPFDICLNKINTFSDENVKTEETLGHGQTNLALVEYTSGSTGLPKGVRISHNVVMNRLKWQFEALPFGINEKTGVFKTVLSFIDSVMEIWGPLFCERSVLVVPDSISKDPSKFVQILENYNINRLIVVPTLLKSILTYLQMDIDNKMLHNLTLWTATSETLTPQLCLDFYNYFDERTHTICNLFGTTESGGDFLYYIVEGKKHALSLTKIPIGFPIFNTIVYILDEEGQPVKHGQQGELYVSGLNLADSYVNGREKERFSANPFTSSTIYLRLYRTGDYAHIDHKGVIQYEGRTDTQVKVRGQRINLREIELRANEIEGVKQAVVLAQKIGKDDQSILCFVVINDEKKQQMNAQDIEVSLRKVLIDYMVPDNIFCIDQIPLTISGKTDRQSLISFSSKTAKSLNDQLEKVCYRDIAEENIPKAKILTQTIIENINLSSNFGISMNSNFYEIGGNSLNSILIIAELRKKGYVINVSDFLSSQNLKDILLNMNECGEIRNEKLSKNSIVDEMKLQIVPLDVIPKDEGVLLLSESFHQFSELDGYSDNEVKLRDYIDTFEPLWDHALNTGWSFAIKDKSERLVGILIGFKLHEHLDIPLVGGVENVVRLVEFLEKPFKKTIPDDKKVLLSFLNGINVDLSPAEKVAIVYELYAEAIRVSKERGCYGILETNISSLTQQLAQLNGFQTVNKIRANQFTHNDRKPYAKAPDTYEITCDFLQL